MAAEADPRGLTVKAGEMPAGTIDRRREDVVEVDVSRNRFLRGAVELHVLHHAGETGVHGAWLSDELARHGYRISPGTLYPTLHRLEREGLLRSERTVVAGRTRRVYRSTRDGERALEEGKRALRELADEVL